MQATDRVYRIGQTKDVYVHYPMAIADDFDTFDIVLDKLLSVKTKLADSTLFPTEMVEIERQVLYDNLFSAVQTSKQLPLDDSNIDSMNDYMFEAYAAALFKKQGYEVYLTPRVGDKGIDVIVLSNKVNYAIQCKHSGNNIGRECIGEVVTGTKYYEIKHNCILKPLVFTNSYYTNQAIEMGQINGVELYDRDTIKSLFSNIVVNWSDIYQMEENRM
jgi:HJR/Mrr/RecB family endonuclease